MKIYIWIILIVGLLFAGFILGGTTNYAGSIEMLNNCQQLLHDTCLYSNNLTDIINLQTKTLTLFTNFNYTYLDKLDCFTKP